MPPSWAWLITLSPLRQLLAREGKIDSHPPSAQCGHLIYSRGSPSDALDPLIYKTHQGLDKSLVEWLHRHRDTVHPAGYSLDRRGEIKPPLLGGPQRPLLSLTVLRCKGLEPVVPARGLQVFSLVAHWCLDSRLEVWLHCRVCTW